MSEHTETKTGRTYADALVEIFSTWKLLTIAFGALAILLAGVHLSAEPGSQIELFGIVKYQKAKAASMPSAVAAKPDETASYLYPKEARLDLNRSTAIPILDGTLAVRPQRNGLQILGDSISEVLLGARGIDGTPSDSLYRENDFSATFSSDMHLELAFRGRFFSVDVRELEPNRAASVTVAPIPKPTLKLRRLLDLRQPSGD